MGLGENSSLIPNQLLAVEFPVPVGSELRLWFVHDHDRLSLSLGPWRRLFRKVWQGPRLAAVLSIHLLRIRSCLGLLGA